MALLEIEDERELRALHRVLLEAKFHHQPTDPTLVASPWVSRLADRVREVLAGLASGRGGEDTGALPPGPALRVVRRVIVENELWPDWSAAERRAFVERLLTPYAASRPLVEELLALGDRTHRLGGP